MFKMPRLYAEVLRQVLTRKVGMNHLLSLTPLHLCHLTMKDRQWNPRTRLQRMESHELWRDCLETPLSCRPRKLSVYPHGVLCSYKLLCREDEKMSTGGDAAPFEEESRREAEMEQEEEEVPRINVEIPRCVANLGADIHFVKLPNFLSVETRWTTLLNTS